MFIPYMVYFPFQFSKLHKKVHSKHWKNAQKSQNGIQFFENSLNVWCGSFWIDHMYQSKISKMDVGDLFIYLFILKI
jgi:hypothetical protein